MNMNGYYFVVSTKLNKYLAAKQDYNVSFESQTTSTTLVWQLSTENKKTTFKS